MPEVIAAVTLATSTIPGFICAWHFGADGVPAPLTEPNLEAAVLAGEGWIWLHLNLADQRCLRWLSQSLAVPQGLAAEFAEAERANDPSVLQTITAGVFGELTLTTR